MMVQYGGGINNHNLLATYQTRLLIDNSNLAMKVGCKVAKLRLYNVLLTLVNILKINYNENNYVYILNN